MTDNPQVTTLAGATAVGQTVNYAPGGLGGSTSATGTLTATRTPANQARSQAVGTQTGQGGQVTTATEVREATKTFVMRQT